MTISRDEFVVIGEGLAEEYLPGVKLTDVKAFLDAFLDELADAELVKVDGRGSDEEWAGNPDSLFDNPEDL